MSSQERITTILLRLLRGDQLNKQALMTEFNKDESSIRRDISVIKRAFDDVFSEPAPFIAASSGDYRLKPNLHAAGRSLDDGQLLAIALILTASRGLSSVENEATNGTIITSRTRAQRIGSAYQKSSF